MAILSPPPMSKSGRALGAAVANTANFTTTSASYVDVTGLNAVNIVCQPIIIFEFTAAGGVWNSTANQFSSVRLTMDGFPVVATPFFRSINANDPYPVVLRYLSIGLVPNSTHVFGVQLVTPFGGTAVLAMSATTEALLTVSEA